MMSVRFQLKEQLTQLFTHPVLFWTNETAINYLADLVQQASIELAVSRESNGRTLMDIKALVSQICEQVCTSNSSTYVLYSKSCV
mmetsp:Transcript_12088/g.41886  ORF Transcript_12088/g.41886 Transcript_12088/m.41886 type:complete len:85 (-) Transcript_12088:2656-2910(-)